jgi:hypothetical protein
MEASQVWPLLFHFQPPKLWAEWTFLLSTLLPVIGYSNKKWSSMLPKVRWKPKTPSSVHFVDGLFLPLWCLVLHLNSVEKKDERGASCTLTLCLLAWMCPIGSRLVWHFLAHVISSLGHDGNSWEISHELSWALNVFLRTYEPLLRGAPWILFFFFSGTGIWTQGFITAKQVLCLLSHAARPFWSAYLELELQAIHPGWPWTAILPISASQVAGITGVSHRRPAALWILMCSFAGA